MTRIACDYTECRHNYQGACTSWFIAYKKPYYGLKNGGCAQFTTDPSIQPDPFFLNQDGEVVITDKEKK